MANRLEQLLEHRTLAFGRELDRAVRAIAHPPVDPERPSVAHDEVTEADALDIAMHYRVETLDGSRLPGSVTHPRS